MLPSILKIVWALPNTLLGLLFLPITLFTGGGVRIIEGVIEIHGGAARFFLHHCTILPGGASAMTLGHVILGIDPPTLDRVRNHEMVHVRQYERWGPFFIPAYLLASLFLLLRCRDPYRDNPFEREAFHISP